MPDLIIEVKFTVEDIIKAIKENEGDDYQLNVTEEHDLVLKFIGKYLEKLGSEIRDEAFEILKDNLSDFIGEQ